MPRWKPSEITSRAIARSAAIRLELGKGCADRAAALDGGDKLGSAMVADFCGAPYRTLAYVEQIQPVSTVLFT
jgi:hypothetical protein